jgi:hypothetical protein
MMIDAKDFLNHDDAALGRSAWIGAIGAELKTVRGDK